MDGPLVDEAVIDDANCYRPLALLYLYINKICGHQTLWELGCDIYKCSLWFHVGCVTAEGGEEQKDILSVYI